MNSVKITHKISTRMAPSPTGELHIGSLRTILFNYALAKKSKGRFVLRIEDTDKKREVPGATGRILEMMQEFGLSYDEGPKKDGGFGPYIQSERLNIYREYIDRLIQHQQAYYCFCTPERLDEYRKKASESGKSFKYDRHCLNLSSLQVSERLQRGDNYVIRMKVPDSREIVFHDEILGDISINSKEVDDQVLMKSDGYPTYHFAVVVDDYLMQITHVMRGVEWLPSTPKQVLLYEYFGWDVPKFCHLPNLKSVGGTKKLSKREGDVHAVSFLKKGYLPEAIINFIMFLGWNPGTEKEMYTIDEFVNDFSLDGIQKTDLVSFNYEKLDWFNKEYIKQLSPEILLDRIKYWSSRFNEFTLLPELEKVLDSSSILKVMKLISERLVTFSDFNSLVDYFVKKPNYDSNLVFKYSDQPSEVLRYFESLIKSKEFYNLEEFDLFLHNSVKESGYSMKEYFMTLRIAITGETISPPIVDIIFLLGIEESLQRIKECVSFIDKIDK